MRTNRSSKHKRKTEEQFFQVEAILDERRVNDQLTYKVRWVGFSANEDTWEPEENLASVRDLIDEFHKQRRTSSPSSIASHSSRKRHVPSSNESNSSKSRQNSPLFSSKRRTTKSRSGYFEYVPQNQLVASKTQFFNDINEGKVDLTSDLYSRVKNRRRHHKEESLNRPSSLSEMTDYKCSSSMTPPTRHSEPSTPKPFNQISKTPSERAESVASNCSQVLPLSKDEVDKKIKHEESLLDCKLSANPLPVSEDSISAPPSPKKPCVEPPNNASENQEIIDSLTVTEKSEILVEPQVVVETSDKEPTDIHLIEVSPSYIRIEEMEEIGLPRPSVRSAQKLMTFYRDLHNANGSNLSQFPIVDPHINSASISSHADLLFAINNHHWTLLATQPIEALSVALHPSSQHPLVATLIGGEGKSFVLRRLLSVYKDPNFVDPTSGWPLLVIAVFYGRIQAVEVLIEHGANPNASILLDGKPRSALGVAIAIGNADLVSLLILNGANLYKVNGDMTSMQFIDQLIIASTPKTPHDIILKPPTKYGLKRDAVMQQYSALSRDPTSVPPLEPPDNIYLPQSPYLTAFNSMVLPQTTTSLHMLFDDQISKIPTAESLQCIYRLIAPLHARLFREIDRVIGQWLRQVEMTTVSVVDKGQWILLYEDSFKITFPAPFSDDPSTVCALFLIHGKITPPGCYNLWLDDEGPCYVDKVFLEGIEQRPLDRVFFVSTLFPIKRSVENQSVTVFLNSDRQKGICIVPTILRLKTLPKTTALLMTDNRIHSPELPRLRQRQ